MTYTRAVSKSSRTFGFEASPCRIPLKKTTTTTERHSTARGVRNGNSVDRAHDLSSRAHGLNPRSYHAFLTRWDEASVHVIPALSMCVCVWFFLFVVWILNVLVSN